MQRITNHNADVWSSAIGGNSDFRGNCVNQNSCYKIMPFPTPVSLDDTAAVWDYEENVKRDCCAITIDEKQSQRPGYYQLSGFDPRCLSNAQYAGHLNEPVHFQKEYRNNYCFTNQENDLIFSDLTNKRQINQLFTQPYVGSFKGAGARDLDHKDLESLLMQGIATHERTNICDNISEKTTMRYDLLPDYGNPQRVQHVLMADASLGGIGDTGRWGSATRDLARRTSNARLCKYNTNNTGIFKPYLPIGGA